MLTSYAKSIFLKEQVMLFFISYQSKEKNVHYHPFFSMVLGIQLLLSRITDLLSDLQPSSPQVERLLSLYALSILRIEKYKESLLLIEPYYYGLRAC